MSCFETLPAMLKGSLKVLCHSLQAVYPFKLQDGIKLQMMTAGIIPKSHS